MSRFNDRFQKIWECLSTDVMGNSQPTAGVFSGDNFAQGDTRIPIPLIGGMQRRDSFVGKKKKKKRLKESTDYDTTASELNFELERLSDSEIEEFENACATTGDIPESLRRFIVVLGRRNAFNIANGILMARKSHMEEDSLKNVRPKYKEFKRALFRSYNA